MEIKHFLSTRYSFHIAGILLLGLSIVDAICTDFGLRNNYIEEANPLMRIVYNASIYLFYLIKISLPIFLLILISKIKPIVYFRILIGSALLLYIVVLFQHGFWMAVVSQTY